MSFELYEDADYGKQAISSPFPPKPFDEIGRPDRDSISRFLRILLARLNRLYAIEKASLAIFDCDRDCLHITHMLSKGTMKSGLSLTIPNHHSLLYQVLMQGYPIVDNYPELISRNIIERKMLLGPATRSVAVIPLIYEGTRAGLLSLASEDDAAFSAYLEGRGEDAVAAFVSALNQILTSKAGIA